jgi:DNA primase
MATRKTKAEATEARALVDLPDLGVKSGELVRADAETLATLADAGAVDLHPDAVAAAKA